MEPRTQGVPGYFVWEVPGTPVAIHLRIEVVDRMGAEILRGFGAVPKRGAEVGGVLLGAIEPPAGGVSIVRIDDFEPVPCKYARGPSFLLTEPELALFEEACQRRSPVGYYRSHTRDGPTALGPEDVELLNRLFPAAAQVALLVKPFATKPGVAGFFVREHGVFPDATPLEFPFRRWELTGEEAPRRTMEDRKPKPRRSEPATPPRWQQERIFSAEPATPDAATEPQISKSRTGIWMVAAFLFLLVGVVLGYAASRIAAPLRRPEDFAMALAVARTGDNLTVRWNPNAPAVRSASSGVLEIDDGGETKRLDLDRARLSNGSVVYRSTSGKVGFRLVVYLDPGVSVVEALKWPG